MTNTEVQDLAALSDPQDTDVLYIVDDPAVTPVSKKITLATIRSNVSIESHGVALSDETTVLGAASTTVPLATFHMPYAFTITGVKAGLRTAGTGAALITVDIHEAGTTILSTKITIDASEKTSGTALTAAVVSDASLAVDSYIEFFLDQRDTDNVATGLKVYIIGYKT